MKESRQPFKIEIDFDGKHYTGTATPVKETFAEGKPKALDVTLQHRHLGIIRCGRYGWVMKSRINPSLVKVIGQYINAWYASGMLIAHSPHH